MLAQLDLHGLSVDSARKALCRFIEHHTLRENRALLIIHGKGGHHNEPPILKNHLYSWLKQFPQILAFHSACPRDGGAGAVYVLLQRQRRNKPE